jgi:hypothetical protein
MQSKSYILIASLFLIPLSGIFSPDWSVQLKVLFMCMVAGSIYGISHLDPKPVLKAVCVLCAVQGVVVVLQLLGVDPFFNSLKDPMLDLPYGFSGSPNQSGLFFAVTLPIVIAYCPWLLPLQVLGLLVAKTTSAVVGAVIASFFVVSDKRFYILLIIILAVFFTHFDKFSRGVYEERFKVYRHSVKETVQGKIVMAVPNQGRWHIVEGKTNPWRGWGYGNFQKLSPHSQTIYLNKDRGTLGPLQHRYLHAHNDYIEFFFEFGYFGLIFMISALGYSIRRFVLAEKTTLLMVVTACCVAQAVAAMGVYTVHTAPSGMLIILFYGLFIGQTRIREYEQFTPYP